MSTKSSDKDQLDALIDALADSVASENDDEILNEAKLSGLDPEREAQRVKALMLSAVKSFQQQSLRSARASYERELEHLRKRTSRLPETPIERRDLFMLAISQKPQYRSVYTAQHRDLKDLTDEDITSFLEDLDALGVLDDLAGNKSHDSE